MTDLIDCKCGQGYPPTRERCPYCGASPPRYWFWDDGKLGSAVVSPKQGKPGAFVNGTYCGHRRALPAVVRRLLGRGTLLERIRSKYAKLVLGLHKALGQMPKEWDGWLSGENAEGGLSLQKRFEELKEKE